MNVNVNDMFSQYITPYCVLEFETPYWQDIVHFLQTKYGFNPPQLTGELMTPEQYENIPLNAIENSLQKNAGKSFVKIVKEALADKIVDEREVMFEKNKIAFKAVSANHTAVPVFIKIQHR